MAYVPGCQYDLFISYASENNRNRWVEIFKDELISELEQLLGRQFSRDSVFFDKSELRIGQSFPETLEKAAESSAVLVPIVSPSYLTSSWCDRERMAFDRKMPEGAARSECLAPVLVRPVDEGELTEKFRAAQRISFLPEGGGEPWPALSPEWTAQLKKLAAQMTQLLQQLRRKCKPVFLGRALAGLEETRNACCTELQKRQFRAGPESLQVLDDDARLTNTLSQAVLSVHFVGGADDSALRAVEIALKVCSGALVLYRPFGAELSDDEKLWLDVFEKDLKPADAGRYHRIEGKNEQELLAVLEQEITRIQPPPSAAAPEPELGLLCDESDLDLARTLRREIQERDRLTVCYPDFLETGGTAFERMRKWKELVKTSHALLFCWGQAKQTPLLDNLYRIACSDKPEDRLEWYLSQPDLDQKQRKYPRAICQSGEFRYEALTQFLNALLRQSSAAQ